MRKILLASCAVLLLASCTTSDGSTSKLYSSSMRLVSEMVSSTTNFPSDEKLIELAQNAVRGDLKDPDSAQFGPSRVVEYENGKLVCGAVNAKNSYGGYVGVQPFVAGADAASIYRSSDYLSLELASNAGYIAACGYPS